MTVKACFDQGERGPTAQVWSNTKTILPKRTNIDHLRVDSEDYVRNKLCFVFAQITHVDVL